MAFLPDGGAEEPELVAPAEPPEGLVEAWDAHPASAYAAAPVRTARRERPVIAAFL